MKQRDRRARMNGGRPGMVGAIYVDEADLGEAAVQRLEARSIPKSTLSPARRPLL